MASPFSYIMDVIVSKILGSGMKINHSSLLSLDVIVSKVLGRGSLKNEINHENTEVWTLREWR